MKLNVCAMHTVHCLRWLSIQYNNKNTTFWIFSQLRWARCDLYCIFTETDRFRPKKKKNTTREWEGMGVIVLGLEQDEIFPQFFRGIGTGTSFFLWDGRGLKIHSHVTL